MKSIEKQFDNTIEGRIDQMVKFCETFYEVECAIRHFNGSEKLKERLAYAKEMWNKNKALANER